MEKEIKEKPSSLSQLYVYYQRLSMNGPEHKALRKKVSDELLAQGRSIKKSNKAEEASSYFFNLAKTEQAKEIRFLNAAFGNKIDASTDIYNKKDGIKTYIETLNECMNIKSIYERNKKLILNTNGQKSTISFFGSYFSQAFEKKKGDIDAALLKAVQNQTSGTYIDALMETLDKEIDNVMDIALEDMMENAKDEFSNSKEFNILTQEEKNAYKDLFNALNDLQKNELSRRLYTIFKIDKLKQAYKDMIKPNFIPSIKSLNSKKLLDAGGRSFSANGGLSLEAIRDSILDIISNNVKNFKRVNVNSGAEKSFKADNIGVYNINTNEVQEKINDKIDTNKKSVREKNIVLFEELYNDFEKINDGFIIYESAKNYSLNENFERRRGFAGGEAITANTYLNIMGTINKNVRELVGTMINTAKGAVGGNKNLHKDIEDTLARDFAYFLFDDFKTIGNDLASGINGVHLFNLNGLIIPLSFILNAMGKAISDANANPKNIISVTYSTPDILYPRAPKKKGEIQSWAYQKEYALNQTKISTHFLGSFKSLVSQYLA